MTFNLKFLNRRAAGFSLLEVLISLLVISIGILGMMKMQAYFEHKSEVAAKGLVALQIAESQQESVKGAPFDAIAGDSGTIPHSGTTYNWQQVVSPKTIGSAGDAKQVEVKVSWKDRWDQDQNISLVTLHTKY
ncbi:prepilin-type N-terminal cleavage/methylation domain-containing protein [Photobacterium sp. TY1-4]|uniref:type IV pilus modification PilV family protein n=1 Tax=Photobacterium sp. TY1-4 TaxID=2899122 RepID=UPI0021C1C29A|nr:prepilin-type N-terminal cleavage/methylation domain-containing protein [Photobacterium sp. TY1-4]UXI00753.1 prepilin-type N-terminal cleavage/methylation domain-containing protein [Photobacterium sp. TY1-4]